MMSKTILLAGAGAAALTIGAVAQQSGAQPAAQPGTYTLAQVAGRALPTVVDTDGACRDELVSGALTLADGVWTLETVERELCEGRAPVEDRESERGRYTQSGDALAFTGEDGEADEPETADGDVDVEELTSGTVQGGTLTVRLADGQTAVFRR